jgi:hypothetical protein
MGIRVYSTTANNSRKTQVEKYLNNHIRPRLVNTKLNTNWTKHLSSNLVTLRLKTKNNKNIGYIQVMLNPIAKLVNGKTYSNFRKTNKQYGTFIRALATKIALLNNKVNKVYHSGNNKEHLVASMIGKKYGLPPNYVNIIGRSNNKIFNNVLKRTINTTGMTQNQKLELFAKSAGVSLNTAKKIKAEFKPVSTHIVRNKLGFVRGLGTFNSEFNRKQSTKQINSVINSFLNTNSRH